MRQLIYAPNVQSLKETRPEQKTRKSREFIINAANLVRIVIDEGSSVRQCNAIHTVLPNVEVITY
jgi:hypothetical protein